MKCDVANGTYGCQRVERHNGMHVNRTKIVNGRNEVTGIRVAIFRDRYSEVHFYTEKV